ncbi:MAG: Nif3-like dinuclear metal center hexameric protein [Spirochaetales bacterium]|nr:Nif3-like dinuclear metal center hexameric protein [Spirochaetales bacterium]
MKLIDLERELFRRLEIDEFPFDISLNGIQVGASEDKEIKRVAVAVDACQATIDRAVENGADMLFVHHGLFWGHPLAIRGSHFNRVKKLLDNDVVLFACHLPLDAHPALGNNAQMALALGIREYDPFASYKGRSIGYKGRLPMAMSLSEISALLGFSTEWGLRVLPFGKELVETVAIISGSGEDEIPEAMEAGVDCYITGEIGHTCYHTCLEEHFNVIAGGHYQTETFGVRAVGRMMEKALGLETFFIERRTGL